MPPRLDGRAVLVTGAGSGIGRATALLAAEEGATIAAVDVDEASLKSTVETIRGTGGRMSARAADVAERQDLITAIDARAIEVGSFHGVFANAAILPPPAPVGDLDWQQWARVIDVNLTGAVLTLVSARPLLSTGDRCWSTGHRWPSGPARAGSPTSPRRPVCRRPRRLSPLELADRRIRVNVLAPGLTDTPMVRRIPGHIESGLSGVPLGELVPPEEVAALAVHLLSDAAQHITGAVFSVDGGRTAG